MIEKILTNVNWHQLKKVIPDDQNVIDQMMTKKINELIDTINKMQTMFDAYTTRFRQLDAESKKKIVNGFKNSQDPYAEQRNYDVYVKNRHMIGKLCKFKCGQGCYYGILTNIKRKPHEIPFESNGRAFRTCEPVKPDDPIIYKEE